jgi:DNA-binding FadR family transcriptional regulator
MYEVVAHDIVRHILSNRLGPGTPLPPEHALMAQYGIGRSSLREALRVLEMNGLIVIKAGPAGGPVVGDVHSRHFGRMASLHFEMTGATYRQLLQARLVMEPGMVRMAAMRRDAETRRRAQALAEEAERETVDVAEYVAVAADFHRHITQLAGNDVLRLFDHSIAEIVVARSPSSVATSLYPAARRAEVAQTHVAIAKAVARGEADRAEKLMRAHMEEYAGYAQRQHKAWLDDVIAWE